MYGRTAFRLLAAVVLVTLAVPWAGAFAQSQTGTVEDAFRSAVLRDRSDDYATAIQVLEQALPLAQTPEQEAEVALLLGQSYLWAQQDPDRALSLIQRALAYDPEFECLFLVEDGQLYVWPGRVDPPVEWVMQRIAMGPALPEIAGEPLLPPPPKRTVHSVGLSARVSLGDAYYANGDKLAAIREWETALQTYDEIGGLPVKIYLAKRELGLAVTLGSAAVSDDEVTNTETLLAGLQSPTWADRIWAATTIGDIGDPSAASALLGALCEESELSTGALAQRGWEDPEAGLLVADVHATLLHAYYLALTRLGPAGATEVRAALAGAAPAAADYLHIVLAYWGNADVASQVTELVQAAPDGYTRAYAARALGHLGMPEAIPVLEKALEDPFVVTRGDVRLPLVRECARASLAQLGAPGE